MTTSQAVQTFQGADFVSYARLFKNRLTQQAALIPYQTTSSFEPSTDSDSTATKSGPVNSKSSTETDWGVEFINNDSDIADDIRRAVYSGEKVEFWQVNTARKNAEGKYWAVYGQGTVSDDSNDNDADDNSTREIKYSVNGTPQFGWLALSDDDLEEIAYVFHGLGALTAEDDETDAKGVGGGTAESAGAAPAPSNAAPADSGAASSAAPSSEA